MKDATFWHDDNATCLATVIESYESMEIGQTLRHYYYQLLGPHLRLDEGNPKSKVNAYKYVSRLLTDARRSGALPWSAVIDPGRRSLGGSHGYKSLNQYARAESRSGYVLDPWRTQPCIPDVIVEKDAMAEFVHRIVADLRIAVHVAKGYGSATMVNNGANRYGTGEGRVLLYCGDFDPTGLDIERSLRDELAAHGSFPHIERVALTQEDTTRLASLKALDINPNDSRTKKFQEKYGMDQRGFELDTMPPQELKEKLLKACYAHMDIDAFNNAIELEESICTRANKILKQMRDFPQEILKTGVPECALSITEQMRYLLDDDEYEQRYGEMA